uniref:Uncharacterized protein n=1 Tax=Populus alba TaxID=43335 RepID=A0A4U5NQT2_POPAL|nr:hypothetical protein D5086_0000248530 [Populus alba]
MNSDLSTISPSLTSLSLGHIMLPLEEILSSTLIAATILSMEPHLLDKGLPMEITIDSHVEGGTTLTPFLVMALPLTLFAKFATVGATSLLIATTTTTTPSLETPITPPPRRLTSRSLSMVFNNPSPLLIPHDYKPTTTSSLDTPSLTENIIQHTLGTTPSHSPSLSTLDPLSLPPLPVPSNLTLHVTNTQMPHPSSTHPMTTHAKNLITKPKIHTNGIVRYPLSRALLAESTQSAMEPTCYSTAMKNPN